MVVIVAARAAVVAARPRHRAPAEAPPVDRAQRDGSAAAGSYTIGFANPGGVGNGWREAMICSAKAQAAKSGKVTKVTSSTATPTRPASWPTSAT